MAIFLLSAFAPSQSLLCQTDELLPNIESGVIIDCYLTACVVADDCVSSWMCEVSCPVKSLSERLTQMTNQMFVDVFSACVCLCVSARVCVLTVRTIVHSAEMMMF